MTPNEINEAIAVSLGYRLEPRPHAGGWLIAPNNDASISPPDYYSSLDACAEFEASLSRKEEGCLPVIEAESYCDQLYAITARPIMMEINRISATAPQRCEAYLRLKNLLK